MQTLQTCWECTKLSGVVTRLRDGMSSRGAWTSLKSELMAHLVSFNNAKCKVLWDNPHYQYRMKASETSLWRKTWEMMDEKLDKSWQCVPATQKVSCILVCIKRNVSSRLWEVILPPTGLLSTWNTASSSAVFNTGKTQSRVTKIIKMMELLF